MILKVERERIGSERLRKAENMILLGEITMAEAVDLLVYGKQPKHKKRSRKIDRAVA